jgi:hypothetical protein
MKKSYLTFKLLSDYFGTKQSNLTESEIVDFIINLIIDEVNDEDIDEAEQYKLLKELIFFAVDLEAIEEYLKDS